MTENKSERRYRTPLYVMLHPIEGFQEMRYQKKGNGIVAAISVFCLFLALFAKERLFGFAFRVDINPEHLNLPLSVGSCLGFTLINWCICTLFDGNGHLKDVWVVVGYAIAPYVLCVFIAMICSYFLTFEEAVFIEALQVIGAVYSVFLLIKGIEAYHEFELWEQLFQP